MSEIFKNLSTGDFLKTLKGLTLTQYDDAKATTFGRVQKLIGQKPTRKSLQREQASLFTPLDFLAIIVFLAAFWVSSVHIITHMGKLATSTYSETTEPLGFVVDGQTYAVAHQMSFIFLAEASMLLFMVTWRMQTRDHTGTLKLPLIGQTKIPTKIFSVYLILSLIAMSFVLVANLASGLTVLEALMPPMFTIGLGFHVEHIIVQWLDRRTLLDKRFIEKMDIWEKSSEDPTTHPKYRELLMREVWDKIARVRDNKELADAPAQLKLVAVHRELERDQWTSEAIKVEERVMEVSRELGITDMKVAENLVINDGDLLALASLVKAAPDNSIATINNPSGIVDLDKMTWTNLANSQKHGPYSSRATLIISIRAAARRSIPTIPK